MGELVFQYSIHDTIPFQIDNNVGDVETDTHSYDNWQLWISVSIWFVVPDDGSGWKFNRIKQEHDKKSVQNT